MKKSWVYPLSLFFIFVACGHSEGKSSAPDGAAADTVRVNEKTEMQPEKKIKAADIVLEKSFLYNQYTLEDTYPYKDTVRVFQLDKIKERLFLLDSIQQEKSAWGILKNRRNSSGEAPLVKEWQRDDYKMVADMYGVQRYQSIPLYRPGEPVPERYCHDGALIRIQGENADSSLLRIEGYVFNVPGNWEVSPKYVKPLADTTVFRKAIMIDRTNQNIMTLEKSGGKWLVRSMNPATTGLRNPPYAYDTPVGMFVIQERKPKMIYLKDGTSETGGFAPWASRFSNGGYIHGVPVNLPSTGIVEFSPTLGTTPRSHKCVRNATSHAKYVYDWAPVEGTIVFVYD